MIAACAPVCRDARHLVRQAAGEGMPGQRKQVLGIDLSHGHFKNHVFEAGIQVLATRDQVETGRLVGLRRRPQIGSATSRK